MKIDMSPNNNHVDIVECKGNMAEKGEFPNQSKSTADYEVIELGVVSAKEKRNRLQYTHSR